MLGPNNSGCALKADFDDLGERAAGFALKKPLELETSWSTACTLQSGEALRKVACTARECFLPTHRDGSEECVCEHVVCWPKE